MVVDHQCILHCLRHVAYHVVVVAVDALSVVVVVVAASVVVKSSLILLQWLSLLQVIPGEEKQKAKKNVFLNQSGILLQAKLVKGDREGSSCGYVNVI